MDQKQTVVLSWLTTSVVIRWLINIPSFWCFFNEERRLHACTPSPRRGSIVIDSSSNNITRKLSSIRSVPVLSWLDEQQIQRKETGRRNLWARRVDKCRGYVYKTALPRWQIYVVWRKRDGRRTHSTSLLCIYLHIFKFVTQKVYASICIFFKFVTQNNLQDVVVDNGHELVTNVEKIERADFPHIYVWPPRLS